MTEDSRWLVKWRIASEKGEGVRSGDIDYRYSEVSIPGPAAFHAGFLRIQSNSTERPIFRGTRNNPALNRSNSKGYRGNFVDTIGFSLYEEVAVSDKLLLSFITVNDEL